MTARLVTLILLMGVFSSVANAGDQIERLSKKNGHTACASTIREVEAFFTKDTSYGSWVYTAKENANSQLVSASLELTFSDGSQLIDVTVSPTKDGQCSYSYTRTWYNEKNCVATAKDPFMSKAEYKQELNKNALLFTSGSTDILLLPAGSGCLVQKKEVGFRHKKQDS